MKKHSRPINTTEIKRKFDAGLVNFNLEIQRNSVWTKKQKGMLIHSLLSDYIVPPLYFISTDTEDKTIHVLDGQQRMRSIIEFFNNEFSIPEGISSFVDEVTGEKFDLSGKKFSELNEIVQKSLETINIPSYTLSNITEEEIEEMFMRLNSGTHLRKIEYIRVAGGKSTREMINILSNMNFFKHNIQVTDRQRERFVDQEIVLQCIAIFNNNFNLSGNSIQKIAETIRNEEITLERKEQLIYITKDFLGNVFPDDTVKFKYLKKVNIPIIFKMAEFAIENNINVADFFDWINSFFKNLSEEYIEATKAGSAKKENVQKRFDIMKEHFLNSMNSEKFNYRETI
jgi:uncharacterized protein YvpB